MPQPQLGYGKQSEASIDQVNQWMRSQPWWQQIKGQSRDISDAQKRQILAAARAQGVVVDSGSMEVDKAGNFNPVGHKLRNTLIVMGIAGATIATMGAAGAFSGAAATSTAAVSGSTAATTAAGTTAALAPLAATATVPLMTGTVAGLTSSLTTAAATTAITTAAATVGTAAAKAAAAKLAATGGAVTTENIIKQTTSGSLSYADLLKYGAPVAGNLINGVIQSRASSSAAEAQQKYLEEALAYQKEQDTYARTRQQGLDAQEVSRYGDYQGRIGGFIANGQNSNDRMAALLGLPARSASSSGGRGSGPAPAMSETARAFIADWQSKHPATETIGGLYDAMKTAGFDVQRPTHAGGTLLSDDKLTVDGNMWDLATNWHTGNGQWAMNYVGPGQAGQPRNASTVAPSTAPPASASAPYTTQPQARTSAADPTFTPLSGDALAERQRQVAEAAAQGTGPRPSAPAAAPMITVVAPNGQQKKVPAAERDHWTSLGGTVLEGAA